MTRKMCGRNIPSCLAWPATTPWFQQKTVGARRMPMQGVVQGDPAWNASRYVVFRLLAKQVDPSAADELEKRLTTLSSQMSTLNPDRSAVASEAAAAGPLAQRMAERLASMKYDQELALRMLQQITNDAENISLADERAAEQATMAIDSLYIAYSKEAKPKTRTNCAPPSTACFSNWKIPPPITPISSPQPCAAFTECCKRHSRLAVRPSQA